MITLATSSNDRFVDIGSPAIWRSVHATADARLGLAKKKIPLALQLLESGQCSPENALETARQFNLLRDEFSRIAPEKAVYNPNKPKEKAPWAGNISPVVTSCANLYTTADGKDLLFEVVSILVHAAYNDVSVTID